MSFTPEQARVQFSALAHDRPVYFFDGPGGSQVPRSVLQAMTDYLGHFNSNLGGHFFSSQRTTDLMLQAENRLKRYSMLNRRVTLSSVRI